MGITISATVLCDNCNITTVGLASPDVPLPNGWMRVQGYASVSSGNSLGVNGYFCPTCVGAVSSKELVKKSADVSPDLTEN